MPDEISQMVKPANEEQFTAEVKKVMSYVHGIDPAKVRCLSFCIIERDPTADDPNRVKASHLVLGSQAQMAAMLASTYSAIGRTFDSAKERDEVPKEKLQ